MSGLEVPRQQGEEFAWSGKPCTPVIGPADSVQRSKCQGCPYQPAFLAGTVAESDHRQGKPGTLQIPPPAAYVLLWGFWSHRASQNPSGPPPTLWLGARLSEKGVCHPLDLPSSFPPLHCHPSLFESLFLFFERPGLDREMDVSCRADTSCEPPLVLSWPPPTALSLGPVSWLSH